MKAARLIFWIAAVYGILVVSPLFFMEQKLGIDYPPPINHAEYYYAFAGITLAWQILFIFIGASPVRFRPIMIPSILEKFSLLPGFFILFPQGRFPDLWIPLLIIDLGFSVAFLVAFMKTKALPPETASPPLSPETSK